MPKKSPGQFVNTGGSKRRSTEAWMWSAMRMPASSKKTSPRKIWQFFAESASIPSSLVHLRGCPQTRHSSDLSCHRSSPTATSSKFGCAGPGQGGTAFARPGLLAYKASMAERPRRGPAYLPEPPEPWGASGIRARRWPDSASGADASFGKGGKGQEKENGMGDMALMSKAKAAG